MLSVLVKGHSKKWVQNVQAGTWWGWSRYDIEIARLINAHPHTLVIADGSFGAIAPLAHELKPHTRFLLLHDAGKGGIHGISTDAHLPIPGHHDSPGDHALSDQRPHMGRRR